MSGGLRVSVVGAGCGGFARGVRPFRPGSFFFLITVSQSGAHIVKSLSAAVHGLKKIMSAGLLLGARGLRAHAQFTLRTHFYVL
jgi:hypothetical protein